MNKIFSKVWNKALGQLVVASELAHLRGASPSAGASSSHFLPRKALTAALGAALLAGGLLALTPAPAQAQSYTAGGGTITTADCIPGSVSSTLLHTGVAIGPG